MSQYSIANHSILPLIFRVVKENKLSYLMKDPATSSLILLNPNEQDHQLLSHIKAIQQQSSTTLTHVVTNASSSYAQNYAKVNNIKWISSQTVADLSPEIIGELSICLISAPGYKKDYSLIGVTHMTNTSTKLPVMFVGDLFGVCNIDVHHNCQSAQYLESIKKVKYFPNETYIFPSKAVEQKDLLFAKAVGVNPLIEHKIKLFAQNADFEDRLIPTTVGQEKVLNPFFSPEKYSDLLGQNNRVKCFDLLRRTRKQWMN